MILFLVNNVNVFCLPHIVDVFFNFWPLSVPRVNLIHLFFIRYEIEYPYLRVGYTQLNKNLIYLLLIEEFANLIFLFADINFVNLTPKSKLSWRNKGTHSFRLVRKCIILRKRVYMQMQKRKNHHRICCYFLLILDVAYNDILF